jgi:hypothetical protein
MFIRRIPAFVRASIVPAVALASLASLMFLSAVEPAVARPPRKETCADKHGACTGRCIRNNDTTEGAFRCVTRTCDHQFDACIRSDKDGDGAAGRAGLPTKRPIGPRDNGPGGSKVSVSPKPTIGPRGPLSGGILDTGHGVPSQGPAATGSPMAPRAPSGPPVVIN